jgi:hypothetical protein
MQKQFQLAKDLISQGGQKALQGIDILEELSLQNFQPAKLTLAIQKLKSSPPTYDHLGAKKLLDSISDDKTGLVDLLQAEWFSAETLNQTYQQELLGYAHKHFLRAAEANQVEAMLQLAYGYRHGLFSQETDDNGFYWLLQAAQHKHPRALFELSIHKGFGIGCEIDVKQALQYMKLALNFNYPNSAKYCQLFETNNKQLLSSKYRETTLHQNPTVKSLHQVLDVMECSHLAVLSMPFLQPSKVISSTGNAERVSGRSSMGTNFPPYRSDFVVNNIVSKLCKIAGQNETSAEYLALLKYGEGEEYRVHPDYFEANNPKLKNLLKQGGQRIKTIVCYLNTVEEGGATAFPDLGLVVAAKSGDGVYFENADKDATIYSNSRHAGLAIKKGTKWIVTLWFRQHNHRKHIID